MGAIRGRGLRRAREEGVLRRAQDERVLRQAQDERILRQARDERKGPGRGAWTPALEEAFLTLVRETGRAGAAARALGHPQLFAKRIRSDPQFRRRYREAAEAAGRPRPTPLVRWSAALGERFLVLLRETGNARQAALELGTAHAFANRMKRCPEFRRRALEAAAAADARLRGAQSPFPAPTGPGQAIEVKSMPPGDGDEPPGGRAKRKPPPPPVLVTVPPLETDAEALGGYLRPGRKRKPSRPQPVLRRNCRGRMQVTLAREGEWTSEIEADFLALLRATGNFDASARAVGFQPASVHERERKWAGFARDCQKALAEADVTLVYRLTAFAHALLREPGEAEAAGIEEETVPFDPVMAMKILAHIEARKYGRSGKGRRKGPPERTVEQACRSILAKIEAIERHEKLSRESRTLVGSREEGQEKEEEGGRDDPGANPHGDPGLRRDDDGGPGLRRDDDGDDGS